MKPRLVTCAAFAVLILGPFTRSALSQDAGYSEPTEDPAWINEFGAETEYMVGNVLKCGGACDKATQSCCGGGNYEM